tara:strand:- start:811 stop:1044 length:234 start_codon:yes stop_codon:yes gene_type:complete
MPMRTDDSIEVQKLKERIDFLENQEVDFLLKIEALRNATKKGLDFIDAYNRGIRNQKGLAHWQLAEEIRMVIRDEKV